MTDSTPYHPIACGFHDRLEHWAIRRDVVEVVWTEDGTEHRSTARIADVYAQNGADWLRLDSGPVIRLDRLVRINGLMVSPSRSAGCGDEL